MITPEELIDRVFAAADRDSGEHLEPDREFVADNSRISGEIAECKKPNAELKASGSIWAWD